MINELRQELKKALTEHEFSELIRLYENDSSIEIHDGVGVSMVILNRDSIKNEADKSVLNKLLYGKYNSDRKIMALLESCLGVGFWSIA